MLKKIFSNTIIYGLASQLPSFLGVFTLPLITPHLTEQDYGVRGIIMAYVGALSIFQTLGLRLTIVNAFYHSSGQYKWHWRQVQGFLHLYSLLYATAIGFLIYFITPNEAKEHVWIIILMSCSAAAVFGPTSMIAQTYYQLKEKPAPIAIRSVVFGIMNMALTVYTISYLKLGYLGWFISIFVVNVFTSISFMYPMYKHLGLIPIFNFKRRLIRRNLKITMPTIPHYYSTYLLNSSDRIVMDLVKVEVNDIGKYNLAYTLGNYFDTLSYATGIAVAPTFNELIKKGDEYQFRKLTFILQGIFFISTFMACLWVKEIFYVFVQNDTLRQVYPLAVPIIMAYNYRPMYISSTAKLFYYENTNMLWRITFVAGMFNLIMNFIFIPIFGIYAAAVTTFLGLMYMGYSAFFLKAVKERSTLNFYPLAWLAATCILSVLAYFLVEVNWMIKALITLVLTLTLFILYSKNKHLIRFSDEKK